MESGREGYSKCTDLMYFGDIKEFEAFLDEKYGKGSTEKLFSGKGAYQISVTYQIGINSFRGRESLQFIMQNYC